MFSARSSWALCLVVLGLSGSSLFGQAPYGLDNRALIGPYLNNMMPSQVGAFQFPPVLSATGAFSGDVRMLAPANGLIPYAVNSPLWSDGASKTRWIAVPNDGAPYGPNEQISFSPLNEWVFPAGTVFIKHFELTVDEGTGEKKRLETRLLVRDSGGAVYGVTYKWNPDNSDAVLLPDGLDEDITIKTASGGSRIQRWSYPSRSECLQCHNDQAKYVLGVKTRQLNGDFFYPATARTDNQLRVFAHLGLLNPTPNETDIPAYLKSVAVSNDTVPVQHRIRSWIDANCAQCHRPDGYGPGFDARLSTPLKDQSLIDNSVKFRDLGSKMYQRADSVGIAKMPPLAKNMVDEPAMAVLRQWIASPLEILSVYLHEDANHLAVQFNSHVDPATAAVVSNYSLDQNQTITDAQLGSTPDTVILTLASPLTANQSYALSATEIQDTAPSANTIWPTTQISFAAQYRPPAAARLANISTRVEVGDGDKVLIGGFIVRGDAPKRVLIRGIGPSLASSGIANPLPDPTLELHDSSGATIAANDNWSDNANSQEIIDTAIAPKSAKEAVILTKLPSNSNGAAYTAVLSGANGTSGVGLVELYDLDAGLGSAVLNVSTRGQVDLGENVMIGGFIIGGNESKNIIVRAIGPSLTAAGVAHALSDPTLELYNGNGDKMGTNDNWKETQRTEIEATGIPPTNDAESAILATLPPGPYTAIVRGAQNATGVAVVEAYQLP